MTRPYRFLVFLDESSSCWEALLDTYLIAFNPGDPVALLLGVAAERNLEAIAQHLQETVTRWGYDPEQIPDVELTPCTREDRATLRAMADHELRQASTAPAELQRLAGLGWQPSHPAVSVVLMADPDLQPCLDSIRRHTRMPYEVLVVDPTSDPEPLKEARVLSNPETLNYAKGYNKAFSQAKGRHVVLLSSDTLVSPGWLERMLRELLSKPSIGMVGEIATNGPTDYCLLIRQAVVERIGGLDERFESAMLAISDYAQRILLAGHTLRVSQEGFRRHVGRGWPSDEDERLWTGPVDPIRHAVPPSKRSHANPLFPRDTELTSIVILGFNQLSYTQLCIESVQQYTLEPYELILLDNGSTDGTSDYFRQLASQYPNVKVILNQQNRGFSEGCNQGIAAAEGERILLLNNDTLVSSGWLERLSAKLNEDQSIGIVGPVSNYVNGLQLVPNVPYDHDLQEIASFADQWGREHTEEGFWLDKIVGFCMLIRREVVERIGGFDSRFGIGNYEDDDFCLRARIAGYQIWVCRDVFIHHFGGRTFKALGDTQSYRTSMNAGWEIFKEKWDLPLDLPRQRDYPAQHLVRRTFDPSRHVIPLALTPTRVLPQDHPKA